MELIVAADAGSAAEKAARIIAEELRVRPGLVLGLATGWTMEGVYAELVRMYREEGLDFSHCCTFNLDEYVGVERTDPSSYHYFMRQQLFDKVNIDLRNTHLPDGTADDLDVESRHYEKLIKASGGIDLQLLGVGVNGHLGFNEPLSGFESRTRVQELSEMTRKRNAPLFPNPDMVPKRAITMGVGTILEARRWLLLATGADKAEIVAHAIEGPVTPEITATALQMHADCTVVLDEEAANGLKHTERYH